MRPRLLLLLVLFLLLGCTPTQSTPGDEPSLEATTSVEPPPPSTDELALDHVRLVVINESGLDLAEVALRYGDEERTIDSLPAGASSEPLTLPFAYQAPDHIEARDSEGTPLGYVNLDSRAVTGETPITSGEYELVLGLYKGELNVRMLQSNAEALRMSLAPLLNTLDAELESRIQRGTPFDMALDTKSRHESLRLPGGEQVNVYVFTDEARANHAAALIEPGGATLRYMPAPDLTQIVSFHEGPPASYHWWRSGSKLLNYIGSDDTIIARVSEALDSPPLTLTDGDSDHLLRLYNLSDWSLDSVSVQSGQGKVTFEGVPAGGTSEYQPIRELYYYAFVQATSGQRHFMEVGRDFTGEGLQPPGRYSYVIDPLEGPIDVMLLADDEPPVIDEALLDTAWEWTGATLADGTEFTPVGARYSPRIGLTTNPNRNDGETGLIADVSLGCNTGSGYYWLNDYQQMLLSDFVTNLAGCDGVYLETEQTFGSMTPGIYDYRVVDDILTLSNREATLRFEAIPPLADPVAALWETVAAEVDAGDGVLVDQNIFAVEGESIADVRETVEAMTAYEYMPLSPELWTAFEAANRDLPSPPDDLTLPTISADEAATFRAEGGLARFREAYPDKVEFRQCSAPGYDATVERMLVYCRIYGDFGSTSLIRVYSARLGQWETIMGTMLEGFN